MVIDIEIEREKGKRLWEEEDSGGRGKRMRQEKERGKRRGKKKGKRRKNRKYIIYF
jgi:hypothetical protein